MQTYLNIHLCSGLKEKPMLSAFLYCRDNKALHYTVGKVRRNVSIGINGEDEPRAQSTGKSISASPPPTKPGSLLPRFILKGHQGLWSAETRQPTESGKLSSLGTHFQCQRWRRGWQSRAGLLHIPHIPAASSTHTARAQKPHTAGHGDTKGTWETAVPVLPIPTLSPAGQSPTGRGANVHTVPCCSCEFNTGDPFTIQQPHSTALVPQDRQHSISKSFLS